MKAKKALSLKRKPTKGDAAIRKIKESRKKERSAILLAEIWTRAGWTGAKRVNLRTSLLTTGHPRPKFAFLFLLSAALIFPATPFKCVPSEYSISRGSRTIGVVGEVGE